MRPPRSGIAARIWPGTSPMNTTPSPRLPRFIGPVSGQFAADRGFGPRLEWLRQGRGQGRRGERHSGDSRCRSRCPPAARCSPSTRAQRLCRRTRKRLSSPKVAGEVRELLVEEGDVVKAGQVLARLDGDRLRFELQQTEVNLRKLEREYQRTLELFNRKLVASAAVDNARSEMEWLKAARDLAQLNARLHGNPRADRRRGLRAPHQGRQHHQRQRPHLPGHGPRSADRRGARAGARVREAARRAGSRRSSSTRSPARTSPAASSASARRSMPPPALSRRRSKSSIRSARSSPACSRASASCSSAAAPRCASRAARSSKPKARPPCSSRTATRPNSAASRPA